MTFLQMSISGGAIILVAAVLRALAVNRLPKKTFLALWAVALFRLLVPFSCPSPLSAYSLVPQTPQAAPVIQAVNPVPAVLPAAPMVVPVQETPFPVWPLVWMLGAAVCGGFFAFSYFRCRREFRTSLPVKQEAACLWLAAHPLRRKLALRQSDRISAPLTYGIFCPVILLPKTTDWDDKETLNYLLAHEYVHIRRFDAASKLLFAAAACVHWFNPLVWVMFLLANRDLELSCDEAVVRDFGIQSKSSYALTLIAMEEQKSLKGPLLSHFSKNAIEERITAIMKVKKASLLAILAAVVLVAGITTVFATSQPQRSAASVGVIGGLPFTDEEVAKLTALQFDGYKNMTVADYQTKARNTTDNPDYMGLLERFTQNEKFYNMRDDNDAAAFLFYEYNPVVGESQNSNEFGGAVSTDFENCDNGMLEYSMQLTISDPSKVTVGEFRAAQELIHKDLQGFLKLYKKEELQDQAIIQKAVDAEARRLEGETHSTGLDTTIFCAYKPLTVFESQEPSESSPEARRYPNGTVEDYQSILALKTADYQTMTVADFNAKVLDWANANYDRSEQLAEDIARKEFPPTLTVEEKVFSTLTFRHSNKENAMKIRSAQSGKPLEDPTCTDSLFMDSGDGAWCNFMYEFSYRIADENTMTIGERDRSVNGMIDEILRIWVKTDVFSMSKEDMVNLLKNAAKQFSTQQLQISVDADRIFFETLDERHLVRQ